MWKQYVMAGLAVGLWACGPGEGGGGVSEEELGVTTAKLVATASYDSALRVPRCSSVAEGCDSGSLVNGRGSAGPESNAPNTLGGSCADGTSGAYHVDESIDRIRVYTTDGSQLAPGKQVTIEVTVWAYTSYTSDFLDLYHTNDAETPSWTHVATLTPTGAGLQTLRATYTLTGNPPLHAVRAAFRYGGAAGECVTGAYNDRDDLAFAVAAPPAPAASRKPRRVAAGNGFSLAVRPDGTVWAWGDNSSGSLGDGTSTHRATPVQVSGLTNVKAVAAGMSHSLALRADGTVWAWGFNQHGQLGDGTTTARYSPVQVPGLTDIIAVSAGHSHSLALRNDGTMWAWGNNSDGQLGDGTTTARYSPVKVKKLAMPMEVPAVAIDAGGYHSLALDASGMVWSWGDNATGQLGDGTFTDRTAPGPVGWLTGVHAISAGSVHSLALRENGSVFAWGNGQEGQLGNNTTTVFQPTHVPVWLQGAVEIEAGFLHNLARTNDGKVWAWGRNSTGQLGDGTTTMRIVPVTIPVPYGQALAGGYDHSMTLTTDEQVFTWGRNNYGQLGDGTNTDRSTPVRAPLTGSNDVRYDYSASNTNSALQNTVNRTITLKAGDMLEVGTCNLSGTSATGDTYLRLFGPSATQVTFNDDSCAGTASYIQYTAPTTGSYELRAGCYSGNSCGGTVVIKVTPAS
jgi:alpha-tubulin suppressor-like RCC1 family protein